jgi:RNA recognition motif-containing protein
MVDGGSLPEQVSTMAKRLYVGNLAYGVSSEDLQELFEQYGQVRSAQVLIDRETGRSRGFGFIEMDNDADAEAAIEALDGNDHDGRRLPRRRRWRLWRRTGLLSQESPDSNEVDGPGPSAGAV